MRNIFMAGAIVALLPTMAHAQDTTITIKDFDFTPMMVTIKAGDTVIWKNLDDEPHTVTGADGLFRSQALDRDDSFQFTFAKPGTYHYVCSIHPKMTAEIVVQ